MLVSRFGRERVTEADFDEHCAAVIALNGLEAARFYVACQLAEDAMGEITGIASYREFLEFIDVNDATILSHLIHTTDASAAN
jgi:hypothetical protein